MELGQQVKDATLNHRWMDVASMLNDIFQTTVIAVNSLDQIDAGVTIDLKRKFARQVAGYEQTTGMTEDQLRDQGSGHTSSGPTKKIQKKTTTESEEAHG